MMALFGRDKMWFQISHIDFKGLLIQDITPNINYQITTKLSFVNQID